jgi:hypothetical protein
MNGMEMETSDPLMTLGATRSIIVVTDIENAGEDAFLATITVSVPTRQLDIGRLSGTFTVVGGVNQPGVSRISTSCKLALAPGLPFNFGFAWEGLVRDITWAIEKGKHQLTVGCVQGSEFPSQPPSTFKK